MRLDPQMACHKRKMNRYDIRRLIQNIKGIFHYTEIYTDDIIADGLVGLRVAELALKKIVEESDIVTTTMQSSSYIRRIQKLHRLAKRVNSEIFRKMVADGKQYNMQFKKILQPLADNFLYSTVRSLKNMKQLYEKGNYKFIFVNKILLCFNVYLSDY